MKERITISIDSGTLKKIRQIQSKTIISQNKSVSVSMLINEYLNKGLSKK